MRIVVVTPTGQSDNDMTEAAKVTPEQYRMLCIEFPGNVIRDLQGPDQAEAERFLDEVDAIYPDMYDQAAALAA